jgi:thiol:disulfide interchange protein DsbC
MQPNQSVRNSLRALVITLTVALPVAWSAPAGPQSNETAAIRHNIESRYPGAHVLDIQPSPIPGLFELFLGDQIVYSDAAGNYLILGTMVDTQSKENLTEAHVNEHGRINFKDLPVTQAIKVVRGNGSRVFAVFSDPDCPYCQQLEKTLLSINDFTMYVYLFPIAALHPQAPSKAHAIWCAPDRAQAWSQWMHEKKLPAANRACSADPVDSLQKLGDTLRINSTPTLFFVNGARIAGAMPAPELEKKLAAASMPQTTPAKN